MTRAVGRLTWSQRLVYGLGGFVNNLLAAASGGMMIVLNLGLGMNPALVGLLGALPRLTDALTDPIMGHLSDRTRSRWGRRRPYIFVGALAAALCFAALWQLPSDRSEMFYFWYFLAGSLLFYLGYTVFATPWVALGYELTPDYHERTRLMGTQNFLGQVAYLISPWFLFAMQYEPLFDNIVDGAAGLAIAVAITVALIGILPALLLREPRPVAPTTGAQGTFAREGIGGWIKDFAAGFITALRFRPFLKLCLATFLVFNGFMLVSSFQFYVIIYYVFAGDQRLGAEYAGWLGTVSAVSTFIAIAVVTWLGTRLGKRRTFFVAVGTSVVGYLLKWVCYDPAQPWLMLLPAPLMAFGLGGLFTLMGAMVADVCDLDELESHQRREGLFGSIFWWVVKLGMAMALALGGFLLNATGFDVALEGAQAASTLLWMRVFDVLVPAITSVLALWVVYSYDITEQRATSIRSALEHRRGLRG